MRKGKTLIQTIIIGLVVVLIPTFFLTSFPNPFIVPKLAVLTFGFLILLIIQGIALLTQEKIKISLNKLELITLLVFISYLLSLILTSPNKMEGLVFPGTASALLLSIGYFLIINKFSAKNKKTLVNILIFSATLFSVLSVILSLNFIQTLQFLPIQMKLIGFNLSGSILQGVIFLIATLPFSASYAMSKIKKQRIFGLIASFLIILGIVFSAAKIFPSGIQKLPLSTSWKIAFETIKESPITGVGPGNYLTAFNRFRPIEYNATDFWNIKFSSASNFYLTVITETGLIGTIAIGLLLLEIIKLIREEQSEVKQRKSIGWGKSLDPSLISVIFLVVILFVFPTGIISLFMLFLSLAIYQNKDKETNIFTISQTSTGSKPNISSLILSIPIIIIALVVGYYSSRFVMAEYRFKQAVGAFSENKGGDAYNLIQESLILSPSDDRYHVFYSQVNFALAQSLAQQVDEKGTVTDENRNTITQLVQQSIREAKTGVSLNPERSTNWEYLGDIYRSIGALASNAIDFSIQAYTQAIIFDPINPQLRMALGGLHFISGQLDQAVEAYKLATLVKPDLPNAHFNLARAYRENQEFENAVSEYEITLLLLDIESDDYAVVQEELEIVKTSIQTKPIEGDELETPEQPEQILNPPLELEEEPIQTDLEEIITPPSPTPNQLL